MSKIRLFSSDLDGTLAGNAEAEARFAAFWGGLNAETRPLLVYNSGRLLDDMRSFVDEIGLPEPDIMIGGVGTMLKSNRFPGYSDGFVRRFGDGFDRGLIASVLADIDGISAQADAYQHAYKSSWFLHDAGPEQIREIERRLQAAGLRAKVIYSSARDLDILPAVSGKGTALEFLAGQLGIGVDQIVVAGDTGNDRAMFELAGVKGIVVANALPELGVWAVGKPGIHIASQKMADGVVEGLRAFGVG